MKQINTKILFKMFESGTEAIANEFEYINELNVFPVPDGDTGTNLKITTKSAIEATKSKLPENATIFEFGQILRKQLLMNARGNSGVIFSQIIRGFFEPIQESTTEIDAPLMLKCLTAAKERAYSSLSNPVEGTILTVIRMAVEDLSTKKIKDVKEFFTELVKVSWKALEKTPDLLISLKEAGVVDSGGYGLCKFFEGAEKELNDTPAQKAKKSDTKEEPPKSKGTTKINFIQSGIRNDISEEGFGYCCEFILKTTFKTHDEQKNKIKWDKNKFENELLQFGDSVIIVTDDDIIKLHMHTYEPYRYLQTGQKYGEFLKVKIENMTLQYLENNPDVNLKTVFKKTKLKNDVLIVATVPSADIGEYYKSEFGVSAIINTEVSGNPSTNEFVTQIKSVNSKNVLLVVDDSNTILSAEQAAELVKDKINVSIIKGKNIMESYFACQSFKESNDLATNTKAMNKAVKKSFTGMVSVSIKSGQFKNVLVEKGDKIGFINKEIVAADKTSLNVARTLIKKMIDSFFFQKPSVVYLIYGKDVAKRDVRAIEKYVNEIFGIKCKMLDGNQNIYDYFIGIK